MIPNGFLGTALALGPLDVAQCARYLQCEIATVYAVMDVESNGGGFISATDRRPKLLYEAHIFGRLTGHRYDAGHPNLSAPGWDRALYGAAGAHQYDRLAAAMTLDRRAALNACSWGLFQVLGLNDAQCGYNDIDAFVGDMCASEGKQLNAFAEFCRRGGLDKYLRARDWLRFSVRYNGAGEAANHYHEKLALAYLHRQGGRQTPVPARADAPHMIGTRLVAHAPAGAGAVAAPDAPVDDSVPRGTRP